MRITENLRYAAALEHAQMSTDLSPLRGKTVLVSGATGMLGSCVTDLLRCYGQCGVIAMGRDAVSAEKRFGPDIEPYCFWQHDVCEPLTERLPVQVDYIIHAASNADPVRMAADPVGTLLSNIEGTKHLMDYGMLHGMRRFLFVSSGEVYGQPNAALDDFTEDYCGPVDLSNPRSCYPAGKRAAEVLCQSYIRQYGIDAVIVRPCHLFGPTMRRSDSRAVSEFLWNAAYGKDIVMKSAGAIERSHCYVVDAALALLTALLKGSCGTAYNIADRRYQMTIRDFAQKAADAGGCQVIFDVPSDLERAGYSRVSRAVLDSSRIEALGWSPCAQAGICETIDILRELGFDEMIKSMEGA